MKRFLALIVVFAPVQSIAQVTAIDGDTLKLRGQAIRMWGIDSPELDQVCPDGWPAGQESKAQLEKLLGNGGLACEMMGHDQYGRSIDRCSVHGLDLGWEMTRLGMAWAFTKYSRYYVPAESTARTLELGVHKHGCMPAWEWRKTKNSSTKESIK